MGNRKTKNEILDKIITKEGIAESNWSYWWYYDDDDYGTYHDRYCDCYQCMSVEYEYLPDNEQPKPVDYIYRRGKIYVSRGSYITGKLIDMKTIYSKEILRQKKLEAILGSEYNIYETKIYLKDLLNEKSKNILRKLDNK